jgi:hypothetical protein
MDNSKEKDLVDFQADKQNMQALADVVRDKVLTITEMADAIVSAAMVQCTEKGDPMPVALHMGKFSLVMTAYVNGLVDARRSESTVNTESFHGKLRRALEPFYRGLQKDFDRCNASNGRNSEDRRN